MNIQKNKTLERILGIIRRTKTHDLTDDKCHLLLAVAYLDKPQKGEVFSEVGSSYALGQSRLKNLIKEGYITEGESKKASNGRTYDTFKLTELGEFTVAKLLGLK
jgi:hypothetical protein